MADTAAAEKPRRFEHPCTRLSRDRRCLHTLVAWRGVWRRIFSVRPNRLSASMSSRL